MLQKAHGHLGKVIKMVEEDKYCIEIMQQNLAVQGFLKSIDALILENHLKTCLKEAILSRNEEKQEKIVKEIVRICSMYKR